MEPNEKYNFWKRCFVPRTKKWCREKLRFLKSGNDHFGSDEDRPIKIKVLRDIDDGEIIHRKWVMVEAPIFTQSRDILTDLVPVAG